MVKCAVLALFGVSEKSNSIYSRMYTTLPATTLTGSCRAFGWGTVIALRVNTVLGG